MDDSTSRTTPWSASPSAKARNAVQRSVTALLDELAPERVVKRIDALQGPVEQHRTPNGCVLQAANAALSVSWFADANTETTIGELHILVWKGKVTRRGGTRVPKKATLVTELILYPIEAPSDEALWRATDDTRYDTAALAAKCTALLEEQIRVEG
jgi:hypothetical protein